MVGWGIITWIVVGLIAGWLATLVVPGVGGGVLFDMVIGIVGGLIGGWLFQAFGAVGPTGFNLWSILVAFVGAIVLLFVLKLVLHGRRV